VSAPAPAPTRLRSRRPDGFYGWHVTAFSALVLIATAPGQTAGVSTFIDPMIADLGISRSGISTVYLVGTLTGALALPFVGRLIDRFGVRASMLVIGAAFGLALLLMSTVAGPVGLLLGFMGIRSLGQGALGLTATTAAARWFERRRGRALGIVSALGSAGISLTPVLSEMLISAQGWRVAWVVMGVAVWLVVIPVAALGMRDDPADLGQRPDGTRPVDGTPLPPRWGHTRGQALAEPYFWVLVAGVATSGLLCTAVAFHQISLLGERGLSPTEAAANFIPQTLAGIAATLVTGSMIDRLSIRWVVTGSMTLHVAALAWATLAVPGWSAIGFGAAIGAAGASIRIAEAAAVPAYFGVLHLGSIRGVVASVSVGSTAFGPLAFSLGHDLTGSYTTILLAGTALPLLVAAAALAAPLPSSPDSAMPDQLSR
jgi:nitrate/nitrite transporter NarK